MWIVGVANYPFGVADRTVVQQCPPLATRRQTSGVGAIQQFSQISGIGTGLRRPKPQTEQQTNRETGIEENDAAQFKVSRWLKRGSACISPFNAASISGAVVRSLGNKTVNLSRASIKNAGWRLGSISSNTASELRCSP